MQITRIESDQASRVQAAEALFDGPIDGAATQRFLEEPGHHLLLAYVDGQPVGMVTGVEMTHPDKGTEMFLYELGVSEAARGRGVGTALVAELAAVARRRGCYGMWVGTDDDNAAALATYEATGALRDAGTTRILTWDFHTRL